MRNLILALGMVLFLLASGIGWTGEKKQNENPVYVIQTTLGDIDVELFQSETSKTVANFIGLPFTMVLFFTG
jgi:hypothetical protein